MKPTLIKLFILLSISAISGLAAMGQSLPGQETQRTRILIDATKDGGLWWFPQVGTFDAAKPHQGKAFADQLRTDGAEVVELGRGETITTDKLRGFDLVIRVQPFFPYSPAEALSYRYVVSGGTRLLIIGGGDKRDILAESFGIHFEGRTRFSELKRWIRHPFTGGFDDSKQCVWSGIRDAPNGAIILGWTDREVPVTGFLPYGQGYVVFTGEALRPGLPGSASAKSLVDSIKRLSIDELLRTPAIDPVEAPPQLRSGPVLLAPLGDTYFPQPGKGEWRFDWADTPDAVDYEIVILGRSAATPMGRVVVEKSEVVMGSRDRVNIDHDKNSSYIADHNLCGWSWRVRARFSDGTFGAWSSEGRFNVRQRLTGAALACSEPEAPIVDRKFRRP